MWELTQNTVIFHQILRQMVTVSAISNKLRVIILHIFIGNAVAIFLDSEIRLM